MFELFSVWEIYGEDIRIQIRTYAQQWAAEIRQGAQMNADSLPKDYKRFYAHLDWGQLPSSYIFCSKCPFFSDVNAVCKKEDVVGDLAATFYYCVEGVPRAIREK